MVAVVCERALYVLESVATTRKSSKLLQIVGMTIILKPFVG